MDDHQLEHIRMRTRMLYQAALQNSLTRCLCSQSAARNEQHLAIVGENCVDVRRNIAA
jgi:hypothetical protein